MQLQSARDRYRLQRRRLLFTLFASTSLLNTGCIHFIANMVHAVKGDAVPAEYDGFKEQRLAIYTITDTGQYTDDVAARMLTRYVGELLLTKVEDVRLVREDEVEDWRDTQGANQIDPSSLGRGVKADKVLAIEMTNLRLNEGRTMYRGHADVMITVHDVETDSLEFRRTLEDYTFPATAAVHITEVSEEQFRREYLSELALRIARHFYPYDFRDSVARDARVASFR